MKKYILTVIMTHFYSYILHSQITVDRSHLIISGQVLVQSTDTNGFKIQSTGVNKSWDFSKLKSNFINSIRFGNAEWYPGHANFPSANLASINSSDDSFYSYINITNSQLNIEGSYGINNGAVEINKFSKTIFTMPSTYNTNFAGSILIPVDQFFVGKDLDSTGPYPFIDSIRLKADYNTTSNVDGWGQIITPLGTFNALLQTIRDITRMRVEMKTNGIWIGVPTVLLNTLQLGNLKADTSYQHQYWTNDASIGFPLVSYDFTPNDTMASSVNWLKTKPKQSNLSGISHFYLNVYPNPCHAILNINLPANIHVVVQIFDLNGKRIINQPYTNGDTIDVSALSAGIYHLKCLDITNGAIIKNQKIIKY